MPRKAKKKAHQMPPLSFADKCIYYLAFLLIMAGSLIIVFLPIIYGNRFVFTDEDIIAGENRVFWFMIPFFVFSLMTFILWGGAYGSRKPIFGLPNFKYGPPGWPKIYPVFMKNKPYVWVSERKKQSRKKLTVFLVILLLVSFIPYPWAFYGRECLYNDGSIVQYNGFNIPVREYSSQDIESVEFVAYKHGKYTKYYDVEVNLKTNTGKKYSFEYHNFLKSNPDEHPNWLTQMLAIKRRYPSRIITYKGLRHLEDVVYDNALTAEEAQLLYELFEQL